MNQDPQNPYPPWRSWECITLRQVMNARCCFKPGAPLSRYIVSNLKPNPQSMQNMYTIKHLIQILNRHFREAMLIDPENQLVVICNKELEEAVSCRTFYHYQLIWIIFIQVNFHPEDVHPQSIESLRKYQDHDSLMTASQNIILKERTKEYHITKRIAENNYARLIYWIPEDLMKLLHDHNELIPLTAPTKGISLKNLGYMIVDYIKSKPSIRDPNNKWMAIVNNDPLGALLNVRAFHVGQICFILNKYIDKALRIKHGFPTKFIRNPEIKISEPPVSRSQGTQIPKAIPQNNQSSASSVIQKHPVGTLFKTPDGQLVLKVTQQKVIPCQIQKGSNSTEDQNIESSATTSKAENSQKSKNEPSKTSQGVENQNPQEKKDISTAEDTTSKVSQEIAPSGTNVKFKVPEATLPIKKRFLDDKFKSPKPSLPVKKRILEEFRPMIQESKMTEKDLSFGNLKIRKSRVILENCLGVKGKEKSDSQSSPKHETKDICLTNKIELKELPKVTMIKAIQPDPFDLN